MPRSSASSRTESVTLIDKVPSCRPFRLLLFKAGIPAEMVTFKRADVGSLDDSAPRPAAVLIMQAPCCLKSVFSPRAAYDALAQVRDWLATMAQLRKVRVERNALDARQEAQQKALSVVTKIEHDAIEELSR